MIWNLPQPGDYKYCLRFAFRPTIIGEKYIWLEFYKIEKAWDGYYNRWDSTNRKYLIGEK